MRNGSKFRRRKRRMGKMMSRKEKPPSPKFL
jgi:hypothetical protein